MLLEVVMRFSFRLDLGLGLLAVFECLRKLRSSAVAVKL